MRPYSFLLLPVFLLLGACDAQEVAEPSAARFEAVLKGPVSAHIRGTARLGDGSSSSEFGEQGFFVLPLRFPFAGDDLLTGIILLSDGEEAAHHIFLGHLGNGRLAPGTYEVGSLFDIGGDGDFRLPPFMVLYTYHDAEVLENYRIRSGTVQIEAASAERLTGRFSLRFEEVLSLSRADLEAMRTEDGPEPVLVPTLPAYRLLETPLIMTGTFDAGRLAY